GMIGLGVNAWVNRKASNDPVPKPGPAPRPEPVPGPAPTPEPAPKKPDAPEWKPLRLVWDERPAFEVWVSGTAFRNEGPARSGTAPVGGWIEIAAQPGASLVYHELKWEGQPEIRLRQLGTVLEWSVPGGAWKPLSVDERATAEVGALGLEKRPDLTAPSLLIRDPGVPGMLDLMKALRPAAVTCLRDEHLDLLERIPSLRRVNLTQPAHVSLNALWRLERLTAVDLGTSETLLTIQGVQDCKQLESLLLSGCTQVADLSPIGSLKHLRELMLPPQVTSKLLNDWREGGVLDGLVYLSVGGSEGIGDLSFLRGLKHLSGLDLSNCRNVLELDALEALPPLRYLGLPPNATADDLERLRQAGVLDKLAMLALSAQHLESMGPLDGLTELTALTAMDANKLVDLSALRNMPNLRELRLYGSMSQELCDSLAALRRLRTLVLPSQCSDTQFKQLQASGCLDHLVSLDLNRSTFLADEGPLTQLKNLRLLNLAGCDGLLAPERLLNLRASLPACTILGVPDPAAEVPPAQVPPAQQEVVLNAPTSFTLQNIPVPVGQRLKKGDRIGQLTGPALKAELDVAKARLAAAQAKADLARNELARAEGLFKQAVLSQAEWERANLKAKEAEAEAVLAQKQAGLLNEVIQQGGMVMPFDGVIVKYHVQVGELAKAGEPFLTVRKDR
ncbi:MAG: hypothetical protein KIS92_24635, partial [Planctomycetota bacterium]|nr:hypothetical protein [Planctomycetota bacterium]